MKTEECVPLEIIQMLSKKWALLIPSLLYPNHKLRYSQLADKLEGISPKTLTERLRELEKENIIKRKSFSEIPPRVEYSLTKRGLELAAALEPFLEWAEKWYPSNSHQQEEKTLIEKEDKTLTFKPNLPKKIKNKKHALSGYSPKRNPPLQETHKHKDQ